MKETPLTDSQQDFLNLIRTPYVDGGMRMITIARAFESTEESNRVSLMTLFLQAFMMSDREEQPLEEKLTYTMDELDQAKHTLEACIQDGTVEFEAPFKDGVPLEEAAVRVLRQLELLRPHGILVQACLLDLIGESEYMPYVEPAQIPQSNAKNADQLWEILASRPGLFATLFQVIARDFGDPISVGSCIRQLIAGEPDDIKNIVIAWGYGIGPKLRSRAMQRNLLALFSRVQSEPRDETAAAAQAAQVIDLKDKKKVN